MRVIAVAKTKEGLVAKTDDGKYVLIRKDVTNKQWLFEDFNNNGIPNIDDKRPLDPNNKESVEDTLISRDINKINRYIGRYKKPRTEVVTQLQREFGEENVKFRNKSWRSVMQKLVKKSLKNRNIINDIVGARVTVKNRGEAEKVTKTVGSMQGLSVKGVENYFNPAERNPKNPYYKSGIHMQVKPLTSKKMWFELQVKTKRSQALHDVSHIGYKRSIKSGSVYSPKFIKRINKAYRKDVTKPSTKTVSLPSKWF